jgi:hypothetical protein
MRRDSVKGLPAEIQAVFRRQRHLQASRLFAAIKTGRDHFPKTLGADGENLVQNAKTRFFGNDSYPSSELRRPPSLVSLGLGDRLIQHSHADIKGKFVDTGIGVLL